MRRCTARLVIAVALLATAPAAPQDDRPLVPERDGVFAGHPPVVQLGCGYERAALAPDGSMFALMTGTGGQPGHNAPIAASFEGPDRVAIVDSACFLRTGSLVDCQVGTVSAVIEAIAWWSQDSRHLFANHGGRIAGFRVDKAEKRVTLIGEPRGDVFAWWPFLAVVGPTPSVTSEAEWTRIRDARKWFMSVRGRDGAGTDPYSFTRITLRPDGMAASGTLRGSIDLGVTLAAPGRDVEPTGFPVTIFPDEDRPRVVRDEAGNDWAVGSGEALRRIARGPQGVARWETGPRGGLYGKRPIFDAASGRLLGIHTERDIVWIKGDKRLDSLRTRVLGDLSEDAVIHQVEVSRQADIAFVIHYDLMRGLTHTIYRLTQGQAGWETAGQTCPLRDPEEGGRAPLRARTYDAGEAGWPLIARHYTRDGNRRLVVYLHGGPQMSVLYDDVGYHFMKWGSSSRQLEDLVAYDASGSVGVEASVSQRLAQKAGKALERDAALIARDVKRLSKGYDEVVIRAVSFGAVLVPDLARHLGDGIARAYLAAPFTRFRRYDEHPVLQRHDKKVGMSASFKDLSQRLFYGLERADGLVPLDRWLTSKWADFTPDDRYVFVFGDLDEISRPSDVPNRGRSRFVIVEGGHHAPQSNGGPECWVSGDCPPGTFKEPVAD